MFKNRPKIKTVTAASSILMLMILFLPTLSQAVYQCGDRTDDCSCGRENPYPCCDNDPNPCCQQNCGSDWHQHCDGNCTWWAWDRACCNWGIPLKIPRECTNCSDKTDHAKYWDECLANEGYLVTSQPAKYTIAVSNAGSYGHVAWVLQLGQNQVTSVSEMNCFLNCTICSDLGAGTSSVRIGAPQVSFDNYIYPPLILAEGHFISPQGTDYGNDPVFVLQNGKYYHVASSDIWTMMHHSDLPRWWDWSRVKSVPANRLKEIFSSQNYIEGGEFITTNSSSNGLLIRQVGTAPVYEIQDGKKEDVSYDWCQENNCWPDIINVTEAVIDLFQEQTLSVSLSANPPSGNAPLNGVDLTATVSGTATGTINYTFYCDRSDSGTNITYPNSFKIDERNPNGTGGTVKTWGSATGYSGGTIFTVYNVCDYTTSGTYTAKVIAERGTAPPAEDRVTVTVSAPSLSYITISGSTQVNENSGAQYTCTAYYSDGSSSTVTSSASWSDNSGYASISSSGYLTTSSVSSDQSCTITATYSGKSDTHNVTIKNVAATLSYITISGSTQVNESSGAQYTCTAYYIDGSSSTVTSSASWSENSSYASINSSGYLTTYSVSSDQSCRITASYGGKSDTHDVTIKNVSQDVGSIRVSIVPQQAADAGAQWRVVGESNWRNSGTIKSNVQFGTYTIEFKDISGWTTPSNKMVTVSSIQPNPWINSDPYTQTCTYSISPTSKTFIFSGGTGSVSVTAPSGCSWTATESLTWITITSGSSGTGNGAVNYSVSANSSSSSRTGNMTIAGKIFTVTQDGAPSCPDCSGSEVVLKNVTFPSGCDCECVGTKSITIGPGVTIKNGARVTIKAPKVRVLSGFYAERGAVVKIKQE